MKEPFTTMNVMLYLELSVGSSSRPECGGRRTDRPSPDAVPERQRSGRPAAPLLEPAGQVQHHRADAKQSPCSLQRFLSFPAARTHPSWLIRICFSLSQHRTAQSVSQSGRPVGWCVSLERGFSSAYLNLVRVGCATASAALLCALTYFPATPSCAGCVPLYAALCFFLSVRTHQVSPTLPTAVLSPIAYLQLIFFMIENNHYSTWP